MSERLWNVAVVGAAGMVGTEMIRTLEQRRFPVNELRPLDVAGIAGATMTFAGPPSISRPEGFSFRLVSAPVFRSIRAR